MSRVSSVVLGCFVALLATTAGCKVSVETKDRVVENDVAPVGNLMAWNGEPIVIDIAGVGIAVNGGVNVKTDPNATNINASARVLAMAFPEHKPDADLSIADVKQRFAITNDGGTINVKCPHGDTHGDSDSGSSGCELVNLVIPAGTADKKLSVKVLSGNGTMTLEMGNAVISSIDANANGAGCDINATLPVTQGGSISLVSNNGGEVTARLPTTFATDRIELVADADKIDLGPFTDITARDGTTGRGTAGTGLASLKLTSKVDVNESGHIHLLGQ